MRLRTAVVAGAIAFLAAVTAIASGNDSMAIGLISSAIADGRISSTTPPTTTTGASIAPRNVIRNASLDV